MKKPVICFFGTYDRDFTSNKIIKHGLEANGATVVEVNYEVKMTNLNKQSDLTWPLMIWRVLRKAGLIGVILSKRKLIQKSDMIYVGFPGHFDVLPAWIVAKIFRKKLVFNPLVIFYTGFADDQRFLRKQSVMGAVMKWGEGLIYRLCDVVFADTDEQKNHIHQLFGVPLSKLFVLPIGADDRVYRYEGIGNVRDSYFNVVYYGLYTPLHGTETIIEAAHLLRKQKDIRFLMIGNGFTFKKTHERAKKLKVTNVEFYPHMMEKDAFHTLQRADIFLGFLATHPSVDRIIPNKTYQGLALGKTVLCATGPAITHVFTSGKNIVTCRPSDPADLAKKILAMKKNPAKNRSIATAGYRLYRRSFTPKAVGKTLLDIAYQLTS